MRKIIYPTVESYIENLCDEEPILLKKLNEYTQKHIHGSHMISGHYQGRLLSMISKLVNPKVILEIGTYTGYSALCLAEGVQKGGKLISLERNRDLEVLHTKFLNQNSQIEVKYGDALETIPTLKETIDMVFIDADKGNYKNYFDLVLPKMSTGGVILSDNILWKGKVAETIEKEDKHAKIIHSIDEFNKKLHEDPRVEHIILPIRDGISIARKL
ncbi:caffeoyl-CoA O-methyltransferase [Flavobacteriaceae bacterium UJ101]|nr:caffeoyl-CoA O-methyltransferase [Flavobacteriaceae bacterium UJ101]